MNKNPLVLLPLDDRPVNSDDPCRLAAIAGEALRMPPRALLGRFLTPGNTAALSDWLARELPAARAAIISLDMLCYGGLVASRTPAVSVAEALQRLAMLRELKARRPGLRIYAFNVIMRLTITGSDAETVAAGRDIFRYSVLRDQAERLGDPEAAAELARVTARLPPALLTAYLAARARNHAVNRAALELLADGVLDFLALVQEDTAPDGLHVSEQQALRALASSLDVESTMRLYAGTDEAAQTLLARYLLAESGLPFPVNVRFRDAKAALYPALYEDVPLAETVRRHVDAVGGVMSAAGLTLAVHTFTPPQPDISDVPPLAVPHWKTALKTFPPTGSGNWLASLGIGGQDDRAPRGDNWPASPGITSLAVADVAYCNGGDPHLLEELCAAGLYPELHGYAGWNTAGNTLGTTLAHAALRAIALAAGHTPMMENAHRRDLFARLLDDGLYQPIVRRCAMSRAEEFGASPLNLGTTAGKLDNWVNHAMQTLWHELRTRHPGLAVLERPFRISLPWGRLFEIRPEMLG